MRYLNFLLIYTVSSHAIKKEMVLLSFIIVLENRIHVLNDNKNLELADMNLSVVGDKTAGFKS